MVFPCKRGEANQAYSFTTAFSVMLRFLKAQTHDASLCATLRHEVACNVADDGHKVKQLRVMLQK